MLALIKCITLYLSMLMNKTKIFATTFSKNSQGLTDLSAVTLPEGEEITFVSFQNNDLTRVPVGYFKNLPSLDILHLSTNEISVIEDKSFLNVPSITMLGIHTNQLREIKTHMFSGLVNLRKLYLHRNQINLVQPDSFKDLSSLNEFNIFSNQLHTLTESVFDALNHPSALYSFTLKENPLECDCLLSWLLITDWLNVAYASNTICAGPSDMIGRQWNSLSVEDLICRDSSIHEGN